MVSSDIFFRKWGVGVVNFCLSVLRNVAGRYEKPSKTQTIGPKRLKYGLKLSQEDTLDVPRFRQAIFFKIGV